MSRIAATFPRYSSSTGYVKKSLLEAKVVFVHHNTVRKPLQVSYQKSKHVLLDLNGK